MVIPCYNEPEIIDTLQSIKNSNRQNLNMLVAIVINSGINASESTVIQNRSTFKEVERFSVYNNEIGLLYFPLLCEDLPKKHAGVGLARKIGMDLAVDYFYSYKNKRGVIVSLDADCKVSENFFVAIFNEFTRNENLNATIHSFHHRVEQDNNEIESAIRQYETYLRYFSKMLKNTGFPYYYHTIGSAFAVTADAYVRVGGMGRQQGGEDFYFLQKIFQLGEVKELTDVVVCPMARFSDRVPFGTGPALQKIIDESDSIMRVYSQESFYELKRLIDMREQFYRRGEEEIVNILSCLQPSTLEFLKEINFVELLNDCNNNCSNIKSYNKRFFHHFNTFRIIKYLNFVHPSPFPYQKINDINIKI